jgi:serine/threonine protein phosphatase PrpC
MQRQSVVPDHLEVSISPALGGVTDRGRQRTRNEDFVALGALPGIDVAVVCDGVSKSQQSDRAARAAATCMCEGLLKSLSQNADGNTAELMRKMVQEADAAVRALPADAADQNEPAETTIVAGVRRGSELTLAWIGDSRAYWIDETGMRQLSTDHSWVNEVVAAGELTMEQALNHANAHGITRTLGGPGATGDDPSTLTLTTGQDIKNPGWLLLCTDGFWDSHSSADHLATTVTNRLLHQGQVKDAAARAKQLVEDACLERGHDNVTVALLGVG